MPHKKIYLVLFLALFFIPLGTQAKNNAMTFNIRYDTPKDGVNRWDNRKEKVLNIIRNNKIGVIGMQEALHSQVTYLDERLVKFDYVGVGRDNGMSLGEYSPIFYRSDKYKLMDWDTFWLSETPNKPSKGWNAASYRIVTWAKFKNKKSKKVFYVFNTHFDKKVKAKRQSVKLLLKKINNIASDKPTIVMGDFNAMPDLKAYNLLTEELTDSQFEAKHKGPKKTYNGFTNKPKKRIDYIFTKGKVKIKKHETIKSKASDHYPILINFAL